MTRICSAIVLLFPIAALPPAYHAFAQVPAGQVPLRIQLTAGGQRFDYNGLGACEWTTDAFVYEMPATRWTVRHSESNRHFQLVLWRPLRGSADMMAMTVRLGGESHRVNTVRTRGRSEALGAGRVAFVRQNGGGSFTVHATSDLGATISGTITCGGFVERKSRD